MTASGAGEKGGAHTPASISEGHEPTVRHTPGPWLHSTDGTLPIQIVARDKRWKDSEYTHLANVEPNMMRGTGDFSEAIANARLIAAAPALVAALKKAERWLSGMHSTSTDDGIVEDREQEPLAWEEIDTMRAALALATAPESPAAQSTCGAPGAAGDQSEHLALAQKE